MCKYFAFGLAPKVLAYIMMNARSFGRCTVLRYDRKQTDELRSWDEPWTVVHGWTKKERSCTTFIASCVRATRVRVEVFSRACQRPADVYIPRVTIAGAVKPCSQHTNWTEVEFWARAFYRAMLCIRGTIAMGLCLSVRLSQVGVLLKRLHVGSHKQHRTIAQVL